jgi:hypothetical protein
MQTKAKHGRSSDSYPKKSLNKLARKRQLMQICMENQAMLKRLNEKKSSYNIGKWERERIDKEKVLANICEYPYKLGVTDDYRKRNGSVTRNSSVFSRPVKKPRKLEPLENSKVVFKRGMNISDRSFLVEMLLEGDILNVSVYDVDNPETFTLEIPIEEAILLMGGKGKYEALAKQLSMEDGELVLIEPPTAVSYRRSLPDSLEQKDNIGDRLEMSMIEPTLNPLYQDRFELPEKNLSYDQEGKGLEQDSYVEGGNEEPLKQDSYEEGGNEEPLKQDSYEEGEKEEPLKQDSYDEGEKEDPFNMQNLVKELNSIKEDLKYKRLTPAPGESDEETHLRPREMSIEESIKQIDQLKSEISS